MQIRDGDWTLLDYDAATGRSVWYMYDERGRFIQRIDTPVQTTLDENAAARNSAPGGWGGDYHRIASVPMQLLYDENIGLNKAIQQGDEAHVRRWLNSSDNRAWRTKEGVV